mgnify:CR=1 FL=1
MEWLLPLGAAAYFLLCSSYFLWDGGHSLGPRHFVPALPLLLWPLILSADSNVVRALTGVSVATILIPTAAFPFVDNTISNPWLSHFLPAWTTGPLNNNWGMLFGLPGALSLAPLLIVVIALWPWHTPAAENVDRCR